MKYVYSYNELPRIWLAQSQDEGRSPGKRMWFRGDTIYSYSEHFPIAKLFDAPNGEQVILFTTRTHSVTTTKHVRCVQSAVNQFHRRVVYCVMIDRRRPSSHEYNLADFKNNFDKAVTKHAKARRPNTQREYASDVHHYARMAQEYCEVMCLSVPAWATLPAVDPGDALKAALIVHGEPNDAEFHI